jgi:hypothetical protein
MKKTYPYSRNGKMIILFFGVVVPIIVLAGYLANILTGKLWLITIIVWYAWIPFGLFSELNFMYILDEEKIIRQKKSLIGFQLIQNEYFLKDISKMERDYIINWKNPLMNVYKIRFKDGKTILVPSAIENLAELLKEIASRVPSSSVDTEIKGFIETGRPVRPQR